MEPCKVKLRRLLKDCIDYTLKGSKETEVSGISANSKFVAPGDLFVAKKGLSHDGAEFIPDAVAAGAMAILSDIYNPFFPNVTQIVASDVTAVEAAILQEFYQHADAELFLVGITGTNGKTTTAYMVKHLLDQLQGSCGLIGTVECIVGEHVFPAQFTTPDLITNYKLFREMALHGCKSAVMEVSSIGIDQQRVRCIEFDVGVFTNLTQDHLDYHKSMEQYAAAKAKFFTSLSNGTKPYPKKAVVNADSSWAPLITQDCPAPILSYGILQPCDLRALDIRLTTTGTTFQVVYQERSYPFVTPLIGRHNVYNLLAALGVGLARGLSIEACIKTLQTFAKVRGRLERVPNAKDLNIFVDYAHTDDALKNVLQTLKELAKGRLITVFGCGGNRDQLKRPKMGAVVEEFSDLAIVTSDNPRGEDPHEIIQHILNGFRHPEKTQVLVDRAEAIARAISLAHPHDIVLIAGKGHETTQVFSHGTVAFDDRLVATQICAK